MSQVDRIRTWSIVFHLIGAICFICSWFVSGTEMSEKLLHSSLVGLVVAIFLRLEALEILTNNSIDTWFKKKDK